VAFGFNRGARIHAVTFAKIIPGAGSDRADHNDRQKKEYPPSIHRFRTPFTSEKSSIRQTRSIAQIRA
jgi:hypothetical protein